MMCHHDHLVRHQAPLFCAAAELDQITFCAWIGQAMPGDRLEYHRGFLGIDSTSGISMLPEPERSQLNALAKAAYRAFEAGFIDLVQERIGPDHFAYIAVARTKPLRTPIPLDSLLSDKEAA